MQFSDHIQLIFNVRAGVAICKLNVRGFQSHPLPVIFSCKDCYST